MVSTDGGGDELTHLYVRGTDGQLKDIIARQEAEGRLPRLER